jgi:hypothetical protein
MSKKILANVIAMLHVILISFVTFTPFVKVTNGLLCLHIVTCVGLLCHWLVNDDGCFLTILEAYLRGIDKSESMMHRIISPLYKIDDVALRKTVTFSTICLCALSFWRLHRSLRGEWSLKNFLNKINSVSETT